MAAKKYLFLDIEATGNGTNPNHNVIEIGAEIGYEGKALDDVWIQMSPDEKVVYQVKRSGQLCHKARATQYATAKKSPQAAGFAQGISWLDKHVDRYNPNDKLVVLAYNAGFDQQHIINLFNKHNNKYMGAYFKAPFVCINEFSLLALNGELNVIKNRKLESLGRLMGLSIEDEYLHQAGYDAKLAARTYGQLLYKFRANEKYD